MAFHRGAVPSVSSRLGALGVAVVASALVGTAAQGGAAVPSPAGARAVSGPTQTVIVEGAGVGGAVADAAHGVRDLHVVRIVPRGFEADPAMTPDRVRAAVAGASDYWSEQTRGAISFRVASISDWMPSDLGCGDPAALWAEARSLVPQATGPRTHLLVVAPGAAGAESTGCDYGYGSLGTRDSGGSTYVTALHPELLAHELGHNLGLGHAGALECTAAQDGRREGATWQEGCSLRAYDDLYDVMGYSGEGFGGGYLGAVGVDDLDVDPEGIRTVDASTSGIRLLPISRIGEGRRFVRIAVPGEPVYYLEYRTRAGRDAAIASGEWRPSTGIRVLRAETGGGSVELDATPSGWRYDRALRAGRTFTSASGRIRVHAVAEDASGATLDVVVADR